MGYKIEYKKEIVITLIITLSLFFLRYINIFQIDNRKDYTLIMILIITSFSILSIYIQNKIDKNYKSKNTNYENLNILKYISAFFIIILHLRPFLNFSRGFDFAFNNIITRICVPIFFVITGYFVAKNEKEDTKYIDKYIKKMIPLYLIWSAIYVPVLFGTMIEYLPEINAYISTFNISLPILIVLLIILTPIALIIGLVYTGVYYHLWYFPATILSLLLLKYWKKKFSIQPLLIISFILLLFGATETYWGVISTNLQQLLSYYYKIFFTTRNFLFFGLFYVVLGYYLGTKKEIYSKYCFGKLIFSIFLLVLEATLLHNTQRLNSNILLSCIPLVYYIFIVTIYISNKVKDTKDLRDYSKYYYLVHPMIIYILTLFNIKAGNPFINILIVLMITHFSSIFIIKVKEKHLTA